MDKKEFLKTVLDHAPRATNRERVAIYTELSAHIEDHAEVLTDLGHVPEEAQAKAVEAMGEPAEIGRAINAQLSPFWLWLGRAALALSVLLFLVLNLTRNSDGWMFSLEARFHPEKTADLSGLIAETYSIGTPVDARKQIGDNVLQAWMVYPSRDGACVSVGALVYNTDPFRKAGELLDWTSARSQHGEAGERPKKKTRGNIQIGLFEDIPIERGDTYITLTYSRFGETYELQVPLEGGDAP